MNYIKNLFLVLKLMLVIAWPTTLYAAQITFGQQMAAIPPMSILITCLLSTLSGLTSLLNRLKQEYEVHGEVRHIKLFVASNLMGSNLAGILAFFGAEWVNLDVAVQAAGIILAAFGGVWIIERAMVSTAYKLFPDNSKGADNYRYTDRTVQAPVVPPAVTDMVAPEDPQ